MSLVLCKIHTAIIYTWIFLVRFQVLRINS
nr:MAG TPA: hypothetical protein [Ackermannviridae sp.]